MNTGRFVGASVAVFVVRTILNFVFYGKLMHGEFEAWDKAYPGAFREVIPAYIVIDLIAAFLIVWLIVKAASCLGGGMKGAVTLAIFLAILGPILYNVYFFFSVTFYTINFFCIETLYLLVAYAIQGAVAAAIYKTA